MKRIKHLVRGPSEKPGVSGAEPKRRLPTRRDFIRTGAILGAGIVATTYLKPDLQSIKIPRAFASASAPPSSGGCTPGFWKNHTNEWSATGYQTGDSFNGTFGITAFSPDRTLLEATHSGGGGANALGRHAVAALLNAAAIGASSYGLTEAQVKDMVQDAFGAGGDIEGTKNTFESLNERSCPFGGKLP